jgi:glycosyltransferase involved in cell wall biosynthesis
LKFLSNHFDVTAVSGAGEDLQEVRERENVRTYEIEIQRSISPVKDFISLVKLYLYFRREKPDIIHSITPKAGLLCMIAGKVAGVPIRMHTFTGLIFPTKKGFMQKLLIAMDQLLCSAATNIYPEGNGVKNDLINYKITSKPLKVLANGNVNGIDLEYFNPSQISSEQQNKLKEELNIHPGDFVFVFVGRLVRDKGTNELITAFSQTLKCSNTQMVKLLLVGTFETELDPLLPETLMEIKSNPNIISVGFKKDVRPYFIISDCLVFPSYREGFPNVVIQAGAMGLPSIVSDISGCNEIVTEGKNGMIIPVKDEKAIQFAMKQMMTDEGHYQNLKKNSRLMIANRYEQSAVWNALLEEYNNHLKKIK